MFFVAVYGVSWHGPRGFDMLRDTQRHGARGICCGLRKRLKHFQNARLIFKYDLCAVKRVDAEEQRSAQWATSNYPCCGGLALCVD
jgi:hypothetical protein